MCHQRGHNQCTWSYIDAFKGNINSKSISSNNHFHLQCKQSDIILISVFTMILTKNYKHYCTILNYFYNVCVCVSLESQL